MACQLGIAVAVDLVDGAADLAALDMGAADVIGGTDQRGGQRLDPVAVDDHQIGAMFLHEIGKPDHRFGQNHVLWIAGALVEEFMHGDARHPVDLELGQPVALQHMHAGDEKRHGKTGITRGHGQRFQLAEIGAGACHEKDVAGHGGSVARMFGGPDGPCAAGYRRCRGKETGIGHRVARQG